MPSRFEQNAIIGNMITDPSSMSPPGLTADQAWQQVETLLDEIAQAARPEVSAQEFHATVLDRLVRSVAAIGGAIWTEVSGRWTLNYQINLDRVELKADREDHQRHAGLLAAVASKRDPQLVSPHAGDDLVGNPTEFLLILVPLVDGDRPVAIIELFQRPEPRSDLQQGYLRIATAAGELAGDYYRDCHLQRLVTREAFWDRFRAFSEAVHGSIELRDTAYAIANEGCRLLSCDRLSVAVRRGGRYRLVAISGVDTIQHRANLVRRAERLIELSLRGGLALLHPGEADDLPPEIESALDAYLDESHVRYLKIQPLFRWNERESEPGQPLGALVAERFDADIDTELQGRLEAVAGQAAPALGNALEADGLPLIGLSRMLRSGARCLHLDRLPWTISVAGLIAVSLLALTVIPADFTINARGELQPKNRCHIFAPNDGIVISLPQDDGDVVRQGDRLAMLRSSQLDLQFSEVEGRRRTVQEQLSAVQAARMGNESSADDGPVTGSLSADEEQLKEELSSLDEQFQILVQQQRELEIRSPIDGQVLTFDLKRLLAERPVRRGDRLMTVADLEGPWELELQIDDDQAGHVLAAWEDTDGGLTVSYLVTGQPGVRYQGKLREVGSSTVIDDGGRAVVPAYAVLGNTVPSEARPAATVIAKINCGRRPIGFVWFRALLEAIQSRVLF
jgi:multidrug efflux pump subunit AcrA (membrane-fusion protein)